MALICRALQTTSESAGEAATALWVLHAYIWTTPPNLCAIARHSARHAFRGDRLSVVVVVTDHLKDTSTIMWWTSTHLNKHSIYALESCWRLDRCTINIYYIMRSQCGCNHFTTTEIVMWVVCVYQLARSLMLMASARRQTHLTVPISHVRSVSKPMFAAYMSPSTGRLSRGLVCGFNPRCI